MPGRAIIGKHREDAHLVGIELWRYLAQAAAGDLHVAAEHGSESFAAAFEGHIAQLLRIDAGGAGDQRGLHPVLAADSRTGTEDHAARVFLYRGDQVIERLGRVMSKDQLAAQVFGLEEDASAGAIEIYIHRLRKKLEGSAVRIVTFRGLGYLLEAADA